MLTHANLQGVDLHRANLTETLTHKTNLKGANLRQVRGLSQQALAYAIGDEETRLPKGLQRPANWYKDIDESPPDDQTPF